MAVVGDELLTNRGGTQRRGTHQYRLSERAFQRFDPLGQRRLSEPELTLRSGKRAELDDGGQGAQKVWVQHTLRHYSQDSYHLKIMNWKHNAKIATSLA